MDPTKIFGPYFDGSAKVYADPIKVHYRLWSYLDGEPDKYFGLMNQVGPDQAAYREKVEAAVRKAFDLTPFDRDTGEGLLQEDILELLDLYLEYRDEKKVSGG